MSFTPVPPPHLSHLFPKGALSAMDCVGLMELERITGKCRCIPQAKKILSYIGEFVSLQSSLQPHWRFATRHLCRSILITLLAATDKPWHCVATCAMDGKGVAPVFPFTTLPFILPKFFSLSCEFLPFLQSRPWTGWWTS